MLLGGCATAVFDERACPTIEMYTPAQLRAAAAEYEKAGGTIKLFVRDYGKLRDKVRSCRGERLRR